MIRKDPHAVALGIDGIAATAEEARRRVVKARRREARQSDFRVGPWTKTTHDGKVVWTRVCHELVGGRWEGFVAMSFKEPKS